MVNKVYLAISYFFCYLAVYLSFIVYSLFSVKLNRDLNKVVLPENQVINNTASAITSFSGWGDALALIMIILITFITLSIVLSVRSMGAAI